MKNKQSVRILHPARRVMVVSGMPVIRVLNGQPIGEPFESQREAARVMRVNHSSICAAVNKGWQCRGFHWWFADMPGSCQPHRVPRPDVPVIEKRTGKFYPSIWAAAKKIKSRHESIRRALKTGRPAMGSKWKRAA